MKTLTQSSALGLSLLFTAISLSAQSSPDLRFGGHVLGETAKTFFATAKLADSKVLAKDYCNSLLEDPKTKEKLEAARDSEKQKGLVILNKQDFSLLDVPGCKQVMAALRGEDSNVGARLASELGKGTALFASGKLAAFNLSTDSPYPDAVADMQKRFGVPGEKYTVLRPGWPSTQEMRWEANGVFASVFKNQFSDGVVILFGYLQPPYDSFLRGTPGPEPSVGSSTATDSAAPCEAALSESTEPAQVSGGVMTGMLIHKVQPLYPESAKQNHIEGAVVLQAVIDKCGHVGETTPISGPAELLPATIAAVQQWQYRPFLLAGKPVAVITRITVNFKLSH